MKYLPNTNNLKFLVQQIWAFEIDYGTMNINIKISKLGGFQSRSIVYFGINYLSPSSATCQMLLSISSTIQDVDWDPNKIQDDFHYPK
jgi:hypothetical protein